MQGECTITYEDCEASQAAVNWFNGKEFDSSHVMKVSIAQRKAPEGGFQKRGRGRGGFGRGGGGDRGGISFDNPAFIVCKILSMKQHKFLIL